MAAALPQNINHDWIIPDWPAPQAVRALVTTRAGGVSQPPYASLNLGDHVNDNLDHVAQNRALLRQYLPTEPKWLKQVHSARALDLDKESTEQSADAGFTRQRNTVCAILTADCLPILLCDRNATVVGVAHAGWRGLNTGIIENTVSAMTDEPQSLYAYLGPAIGPSAFEVGEDVYKAFIDQSADYASAFAPHGQKWLADIYELARQRLRALGVTQIHGGDFCTYTDARRFFSYRRDGQTGRMASLIWIDL